jgi:hypothetical protein
MSEAKGLAARRLPFFAGSCEFFGEDRVLLEWDVLSGAVLMLSGNGNGSLLSVRKNDLRSGIPRS